MSENTKIQAWLMSGCSAAEVAELKSGFEALQQSDRNVSRETFLETLENTFCAGEYLTPDQLSAIFWLSPVLISSKDFVRTGEQSPSPEERLIGLMIKALAQLSLSARGELISSLILELTDISLLCGVFAVANGMDFGPETANLRQSLMLRVEKLRVSGDLWLQASLAQILWFWWICQEQNTYIQVQRAFSDPKALQALLEVGIERRATPQGEIDLILVRRWSKILDFQGLEAKALELALNGSSRLERARARRFLTAFGNGKSELYN